MRCIPSGPGWFPFGFARRWTGTLSSTLDKFDGSLAGWSRLLTNVVKYHMHSKGDLNSKEMLHLRVRAAQRVREGLDRARLSQFDARWTW